MSRSNISYIFLFFGLYYGYEHNCLNLAKIGGRRIDSGVGLDFESGTGTDRKTGLYYRTIKLSNYYYRFILSTSDKSIKYKNKFKRF
jgi:hypothetical protein